MRQGGGGMEVEMRDIKRKREMVVRGFERNTPRKEVITKITSVMDALGWSSKVEEGGIFTVGPMVSFGIVRFKSVDEKVGFKKMLAEKGSTDSAWSKAGLWIGDNVDKEVRLRETAVGKVARALHEKGGGKKGAGGKGKRTDITVDWRRGRVYVGREEVASWTGARGLMLSGEALKLKSRIKELLAEVSLAEVEVAAAVAK